MEEMQNGPMPSEDKYESNREIAKNSFEFKDF
jgi:hypothetical protein